MTAYQVKFTALPLYRLGYFYPNKFTPKHKFSHREKGNKNIAPNERCDKQFGTNGASLFIFLSFEFASSANVVYCMQFVTKLREKIFFKNLIRNPL